MDKFEPGVKQFFVITSLCMFLVPILVYQVCQCKMYLDFTSGLHVSSQIMISGLTAVGSVNIVIAIAMFIIYNRDIKEKPKST